MSEKRRNNGQTLPRNLDGSFQEGHIDIVWRELHERFGFDLKGWKTKFNDYFERRPRTTTKIEAFYYFGNTEIQPVINLILCRNEQFPTFNNFIKYIVKKF